MRLLHYATNRLASQPFLRALVLIAHTYGSGSDRLGEAGLDGVQRPHAVGERHRLEMTTRPSPMTSISVCGAHTAIS